MCFHEQDDLVNQVWLRLSHCTRSRCSKFCSHSIQACYLCPEGRDLQDSAKWMPGDAALTSLANFGAKHLYAQLLMLCMQDGIQVHHLLLSPSCVPSHRAFNRLWASAVTCFIYAHIEDHLSVFPVILVADSISFARLYNGLVFPFNSIMILVAEIISTPRLTDCYHNGLVFPISQLGQPMSCCILSWNSLSFWHDKVALLVTPSHILMPRSTLKLASVWHTFGPW